MHSLHLSLEAGSLAGASPESRMVAYVVPGHFGLAGSFSARDAAALIVFCTAAKI